MDRLRLIDQILFLLVLVGFLSLMALTAKTKETPVAPAPISTEVTPLKPELSPELDSKVLLERIMKNPELGQQIYLVGFALTMMALGSVLAFFWITLRVFSGQPISPDLPAPAPPAWSFQDIFRMILILFLVTEAALILQWFMIHRMHMAWLDRSVMAVGNTLLLDLATLLGFGWIYRRRGLVRGGLRWKNIGMGLRFGGSMYLACLPVLMVAMLISLRVAQALGKTPDPQPVLTMFLSEKRSTMVGALIFLVTVMGPIAEELFFRGILYGWLRVRVGAWRGLIFSALFFAALHTDGVVFLPIFVLGLLFGWAYEKTGSLAVPMALHVFHNTAMMAVASVLKNFMNVVGVVCWYFLK